MSNQRAISVLLDTNFLAEASTIAVRADRQATLIQFLDAAKSQVSHVLAKVARNHGGTADISITDINLGDVEHVQIAVISPFAPAAGFDWATLRLEQWGECQLKDLIEISMPLANAKDECNVLRLRVEYKGPDALVQPRQPLLSMQHQPPQQLLEFVHQQQGKSQLLLHQLAAANHMYTSNGVATNHPVDVQNAGKHAAGVAALGFPAYQISPNGVASGAQLKGAGKAATTSKKKRRRTSGPGNHVPDVDAAAADQLNVLTGPPLAEGAGNVFKLPQPRAGPTAIGIVSTHQGKDVAGQPHSQQQKDLNDMPGLARQNQRHANAAQIKAAKPTSTAHSPAITKQGKQLAAVEQPLQPAPAPIQRDAVAADSTAQAVAAGVQEGSTKAHPKSRQTGGNITSPAAGHASGDQKAGPQDLAMDQDICSPEDGWLTRKKKRKRGAKNNQDTLQEEAGAKVDVAAATRNHDTTLVGAADHVPEPSGDKSTRQASTVRTGANQADKMADTQIVSPFQHAASGQRSALTSNKERSASQLHHHQAAGTQASVQSHSGKSKQQSKLNNKTQGSQKKSSGSQQLMMIDSGVVAASGGHASQDGGVVDDDMAWAAAGRLSKQLTPTGFGHAQEEVLQTEGEHRAGRQALNTQGRTDDGQGMTQILQLSQIPPPLMDDIANGDKDTQQAETDAAGRKLSKKKAKKNKQQDGNLQMKQTQQDAVDCTQVETKHEKQQEGADGTNQVDVRAIDVSILDASVAERVHQFVVSQWSSVRTNDTAVVIDDVPTPPPNRQRNVKVQVMAGDKPGIFDTETAMLHDDYKGPTSPGPENNVHAKALLKSHTKAADKLLGTRSAKKSKKGKKGAVTQVAAAGDETQQAVGGAGVDNSTQPTTLQFLMQNALLNCLAEGSCSQWAQHCGLGPQGWSISIKLPEFVNKSGEPCSLVQWLGATGRRLPRLEAVPAGFPTHFHPHDPAHDKEQGVRYRKKKKSGEGQPESAAQTNAEETTAKDKDERAVEVPAAARKSNTHGAGRATAAAAAIEAAANELASPPQLSQQQQQSSKKAASMQKVPSHDRQAASHRNETSDNQVASPAVSQQVAAAAHMERADSREGSKASKQQATKEADACVVDAAGHKDYVPSRLGRPPLHPSTERQAATAAASAELDDERILGMDTQELDQLRQGAQVPPDIFSQGPETSHPQNSLHQATDEPEKMAGKKTDSKLRDSQQDVAVVADSRKQQQNPSQQQSGRTVSKKRSRDDHVTTVQDAGQHDSVKQPQGSGQQGTRTAESPAEDKKGAGKKGQRHDASHNAGIAKGTGSAGTVATVHNDSSQPKKKVKAAKSADASVAPEAAVAAIPDMTTPLEQVCHTGEDAAALQRRKSLLRDALGGAPDADANGTVSNDNGAAHSSSGIKKSGSPCKTKSGNNSSSSNSENNGGSSSSEPSGTESSERKSNASSSSSEQSGGKSSSNSDGSKSNNNSSSSGDQSGGNTSSSPSSSSDESSKQTSSSSSSSSSDSRDSSSSSEASASSSRSGESSSSSSDSEKNSDVDEEDEEDDGDDVKATGRRLAAQFLDSQPSQQLQHIMEKSKQAGVTTLEALLQAQLGMEVLPDEPMGSQLAKDVDDTQPHSTQTGTAAGGMAGAAAAQKAGKPGATAAAGYDNAVTIYGDLTVDFDAPVPAKLGELRKLLTQCLREYISVCRVRRNKTAMISSMRFQADDKPEWWPQHVEYTKKGFESGGREEAELMYKKLRRATAELKEDILKEQQERLPDV